MKIDKSKQIRDLKNELKAYKEANEANVAGILKLSQELVKSDEEIKKYQDRITTIEQCYKELKDEHYKVSKEFAEIRTERDVYKRNNQCNHENYRTHSKRADEAEYNLIQMQLRVNSLVDELCGIGD